MRSVKVMSLLGVFVVIAACKTDAVRQDVPARIIEATPESRAELEKTVAGMLDGREVTLADDALSNGSLLVIEPSHLMGRDLRRPEQFRLVLDESNCVLIHLGSETRQALVDSRCEAE